MSIDLFSDADYRTINFDGINSFLRATYPYVNTNDDTIVGMGKPYRVGKSKEDSIKLDVFYTDTFIQEIKMVDNIRMASVEEIIAMKVDVISRGGRKKDFWDIHELMQEYSVEQMLALHEKRYPYSHDKKNIKAKFKEFNGADEDFDPVCLRDKHWEVIKLDILDFVSE